MFFWKSISMVRRKCI